MKEGMLVRSTHLERERVGIVFAVFEDEEVMVRWQRADEGFPIYETLDKCCLERVCVNKEMERSS